MGIDVKTSSPQGICTSHRGSPSTSTRVSNTIIGSRKQEVRQKPVPATGVVSVPLPESPTPSSAAENKQSAAASKQGVITFPVTFRVQQINNGEPSIRSTPADKLVKMFEIAMGRRGKAQIAKAKDSLMMTFKKTDGSTAVVKRILQCEKKLELSEAVTAEATYPSSIWRWVLEKVKQKFFK